MKKVTLLICATLIATICQAQTRFLWTNMRMNSENYSIYTESSQDFFNHLLTYQNVSYDISSFIVKIGTASSCSFLANEDLIKYAYIKQGLKDLSYAQRSIELEDLTIWGYSDIENTNYRMAAPSIFAPIGSEELSRWYYAQVIDNKDPLDKGFYYPETRKEYYDKLIESIFYLIFQKDESLSGGMFSFVWPNETIFNQVSDNVFAKSGQFSDLLDILDAFYFDYRQALIDNMGDNNEILQVIVTQQKLRELKSSGWLKSISIANIARPVLQSFLKAFALNSYFESRGLAALSILKEAMQKYSGSNQGWVDPAFLEQLNECIEYYTNMVNNFYSAEVMSHILTDPAVLDLALEKTISNISNICQRVFPMQRLGFVLLEKTIVIAFDQYNYLSDGKDLTRFLTTTATVHYYIDSYLSEINVNNCNDVSEIKEIAYLWDLKRICGILYYKNIITRLNESWFGNFPDEYDWLRESIKNLFGHYDIYINYSKQRLLELNANYSSIHQPHWHFHSVSSMVLHKLAPCIESPLLISGCVDRTNGTTSDPFYFSVVYKDPSGTLPNEIKLHIGNYVYEMGYESGNTSEGAKFSLTLTIPVTGEFNFHFSAIEAGGTETPAYYPPIGSDIITVINYQVPPEEYSLMVPNFQPSYYQYEKDYFIIKTFPVSAGRTISAKINNSALATISLANNGLTDERGYVYATLEFKSAGDLTLTFNSSGFPSVTRNIQVLAAGNDDYVRFEPDFLGSTSGTSRYKIQFILNTDDNTYRDYTFKTNNGVWSNGMQEIISNDGKSPDEVLYIDNYKLTDLSVEFSGRTYTFKFFPQSALGLQPIKLIKKIKNKNGISYGMGWRENNSLREFIYADRDFLKKLNHNYELTLTSTEYDPFYSLAISPDQQSFIATTYEKIFKFSCDNFQLQGSTNYLDTDFNLAAFFPNAQRFAVISNEQATGTVFSSTLSRLFNFAPIADQCRDMVINPSTSDIVLALDNDVNELQIYSSSGSLKKTISIEDGTGEANSVAISPSATATVVLDDDNKCLEFFNGQYKPYYSTTLLGETPFKCEWNPNPILNYLAVTTSSLLYILDMDDFGRIHGKAFFKHINQNQTDLKWSKDGKVLAVTNGDSIYLFSPFDANPPVISHNVISDNITTSENNLTIGFDLFDENEILKSHLHFNGEERYFGSEHYFDASISLLEGTNTITLTVFDEFLNETVREIIINYQPLPLDAQFKISSSLVYPDTAVFFTNHSTGDPSSFHWDFGDGNSTSQTINPSHTYSIPGYYTVSLSISKENESDLETKTNCIYVTEYKPVPPIAMSASPISKDGFQANWEPVPEASGYEIDVALDQDFSTFISDSYRGLDVGSLSTFFIPWPSPNTSCIYRVRAYNSGGLSENSNTVLVESGRTLSGFVLLDQDRLSDNTIDGVGTDPEGILFINLLDETGMVISAEKVGRDGSYHFDVVPPGNYFVQLSIHLGIPGSFAPETSLPPKWTFIGENVGTDPGNDGTPDGLLFVTVSDLSDQINANFGIVKSANLTTTITVQPNVMNGMTSFTVIIKIIEIHDADTYGPITIIIPKDNRWVIEGTYNPGLLVLSDIPLNNSSWEYTSDNTNHRFTSNGTIFAGSFSTFGFTAIFDPANAKGVFTITSQLLPGSGGETFGGNNADSEKLDYFSE